MVLASGDDDLYVKLSDIAMGGESRSSAITVLTRGLWRATHEQRDSALRLIDDAEVVDGLETRRARPDFPSPDAPGWDGSARSANSGPMCDHSFSGEAATSDLAPAIAGIVIGQQSFGRQRTSRRTLVVRLCRWRANTGRRRPATMPSMGRRSCAFTPVSSVLDGWIVAIARPAPPRGQERSRRAEAAHARIWAIAQAAHGPAECLPSRPNATAS